MVIDEALVKGVAAMVEQMGDRGDLQQALKKTYPGIRFTLCSEDDIHSGKPVLESENAAIYLVGNGDHCLTLTNDFAIATGVVVAQVEPE